MLHRCVDEPVDLRKRDDLIELAIDLGSAHAQNRAVQVRVLATRKVLVKSSAHFEQRADASGDIDEPCRRFGNLRQNFQESGFSSAVPADDADDFSHRHVERHVIERPDGVGAT